MKNSHLLLTRSAFMDVADRGGRQRDRSGNMFTAARQLCSLLPGRRTLLLNVFASLAITALLTVGSYLFLVQLSAYGW